MKVRRSYLWALAILIAISGWVGSGILMHADVGAPGGEPGRAAAEQRDERVSVRVTTLASSERRRELTVRGRTEAVRRVALRAETSGRVTATPRSKGAFVAAGTTVCRLDVGERESRLAEARAMVDEARLDYDAAAKLMKKGYAGAIDEASRKARLDAAKAAAMQAEIEIARTRIEAPFAGVIEEQDAKVGAFLGTGDVCATLVDLDPMLVVGQVSERDVGKLELGAAGTARLVTGEEVEGKVRFISPTADRATRTFKVEFTVANPDRRLRDGVTAELTIPLAPLTAHRISPAVLTLDDAGVIGVRTVSDDGEVGFAPVEIIADEVASVWVTGLPERITIITVGQEYVRPGQIVRPVFATAEADR